MAGEEDDKHARTEEPTARKLQKAREKGDVAVSRETGTMMMIVSLLLLTVFRPNLEDRVALSVLSESWFPRRNRVGGTIAA